MIRIIVNERECSGCLSCVTYCRSYNDGELLEVDLDFFEGKNKIRICRQCKICKAAESCPNKVFYREKDGIWRLATEKCIGCGNCEKNCPFGAVKIREGKSVKCQVCSERLCSEVCFTKAIQIIDD
ncbi:MAG: 4Fe-4S dicluster domain-containing protein [Candidatus Coatesbacteria bacterium]|nr:4Fe-4S dicluster domain-containing protein [Candidatus Coatesbacteria bacterium]